MDNAVRKTLNNILDYMGGCEDFRDNAQLRTYLETLKANKEPVAEVPCNVGLVDIDPTEKQVNSACLSYRHDFGLMEHDQCENMRFQAKEWLRAWQKEFGLR